MTAGTEVVAPPADTAQLCAYFRDEARELLALAGEGEGLVLVLGELLRLHARVDAIEALAADFAELGSKGLGGMLSGLFTS